MAEYRSTGKELRQSPDRVIAGVMAALLLISGAFGMRRIINGVVPLEPYLNESLNEETEPDSAQEESASEPIYDVYRLHAARYHEGPLVLIDKEHATVDLPSDSFSNLVRVHDYETDFLRAGDLNVMLTEDTAKALGELSLSFGEDPEHGSLLIASGYRTVNEQKKFYEKDLQKTGGNSSDLYDIPGCSELESGYSFELAYMNNNRYIAFSTDDERYKWMLDNCAALGFIQRYPEGKEELTGVSGKRNVFRFVGVPHAWFMKQNNLCLEEYIELLEGHVSNGEHLIISNPIGQSFEVYYSPLDIIEENEVSGESVENDLSIEGESAETADSPKAEMTRVRLPHDGTSMNSFMEIKNNKYITVSGNNKNGFFITSRMKEEHNNW
ncbi:MAG: D-alanyl-D-alanine carboxypeptidase family protein [Oscillospiraceae bacterium]|nr:D-alanyl-D-alanine carboxypeptidase family protein [Oscillospiraceae bacterium]